MFNAKDIKLFRVSNEAKRKTVVRNCQPGVLLILVLYKKIFYRKTVGFSRIRTRIVRVGGEHADHLTTTTAEIKTFLIEYQWQCESFCVPGNVCQIKWGYLKLQCDQMARLFSIFGHLGTTIQICLIAQKCCQSRFKVLSNSK